MPSKDLCVCPIATLSLHQKGICLFVGHNGEWRDSQLLKRLRVSDERVLNKAFAALPLRLWEHCGHGSGNYTRGRRLWRVVLSVISQAWQSHCILKHGETIAFCLVAAAAACTRLDLSRVNQRSIDEGTERVLHLLAELVSGLWRRDRHCLQLCAYYWAHQDPIDTSITKVTQTVLVKLYGS